MLPASIGRRGGMAAQRPLDYFKPVTELTILIVKDVPRAITLYTFH